MHHIEPHALWVGHAGDGRAFRDIFGSGIRAVVQVAAEEPPIQTPRELVYQRFPLLDGAGNGGDLLRLAVGAVARLIDEGVPVLVCCGAGMSRSPLIAAAALAVATRSRLEDCLVLVVERHPADVSPAIMADVLAAVRGVLEEGSD